MGKLVFGAPLPQGWTAAGEALAISSRRSNNESVPGYGIVNLKLMSAQDAKFGQFSLAIYNLGDRRYYDPSTAFLVQNAIEQSRRQFMLRWTLGI